MIEFSVLKEKIWQLKKGRWPELRAKIFDLSDPIQGSNSDISQSEKGIDVNKSSLPPCPYYYYRSEQRRQSTPYAESL
jgi:hypothetical protein